MFNWAAMKSMINAKMMMPGSIVALRIFALNSASFFRRAAMDSNAWSS